MRIKIGVSSMSFTVGFECWLLTVNRFYYADERKPDGSAAFAIDGEAHGKLFAELAEGTTQGPWLQSFVKGVGYKAFPVSNL